MTDQERLDGLLRHINMVRDNCNIIADKLIAKGEHEMARILIQHALIHDNSKFVGVEWQFLTDPHTTNRTGLKYAIEHHQKCNPHHPEFWIGGITQMPLIYRYEMIADICARGAEMGTSTRDYLDNQMPKKYGFTKDGDVHKQLQDMIDMVCPKPFEPLEPETNETTPNIQRP